MLSLKARLANLEKRLGKGQRHCMIIEGEPIPETGFDKVHIIQFIPSEVEEHDEDFRHGEHFERRLAHSRLLQSSIGNAGFSG